MDLQPVQSFMRERGIDAWLLYDFRGNNPILAQLLAGKRWTTRRAFLLVPAHGEPLLLAHGIDAAQFASAGVPLERYLTWRNLRAWLDRVLTGRTRVAMEYAPGCTLPAVSIADAGTVELVRSCGVEVVGSADVIQACVAVWPDAARRGHAEASAIVTRAKDDAFGLIRDSLAAGRPITELDVQRNILDGFAKGGLETAEPPIVAVNAHAGDPHFEVPQTDPAPIRRGDWVLIDLWARRPGDANVYSDITWVGFAGPEPSARHREVFGVVKAARDASLDLARRAWSSRTKVRGWELDDAARDTIVRAGFKPALRHRTGHSLSPGPLVHGLGMNLDNLETHDTREMIPGIGFTIEPGIYLPEFGVRLEINVFVDPALGPTVTSCVQDEIVRLA